MNKKAVFISISFIATIFFFASGWSYLSSPTYSSMDKTVTVVCGYGFFYDLSAENAKNAYEQTFRAEAVADLCGEQAHKNRTSTDWESKSKQIANSNICVINWELTPTAHKKAYEEECTKEYPSN